MARTRHRTSELETRSLRSGCPKAPADQKAKMPVTAYKPGLTGYLIRLVRRTPQPNHAY